RRERQVLAMLYRARYPLRTGQIASLVWSDSSRTHDVRSVLYRLRRKLRGTPWAIPFSTGGQGVRLVRSDPRDELLAQAPRSAHAERAAQGRSGCSSERSSTFSATGRIARRGAA